MNAQRNPPPASITGWQPPWGGQMLCNAQQAYDDLLHRAERLQTAGWNLWHDGWHRYLIGLERIGHSASVWDTMNIEADLANEAIEQFWREGRNIAELLTAGLGIVGSSGPPKIARRGPARRASQHRLTAHHG